MCKIYIQLMYTVMNSIICILITASKCMPYSSMSYLIVTRVIKTSRVLPDYITVTLGTFKISSVLVCNFA